jgi:hypothetical protein
MQTIDLELDHPDFFCPVTGQQVLSEDACTPSPATAYIYVQEENVFEFVREDLQEVAKAIEADSVLGGDDEDGGDGVVTGQDGQPRLRMPFAAMEAALPEAFVVDFILRSTEMACGPATTTVHVGIDMNWTKSE